jgi:hypothetical protein
MIIGCRVQMMVPLILLLIMIPLASVQTAFAQHLGITDVTVPPKVAVGQSFTVKVAVEWSGLDSLAKKYGPPYRIAVNVCEGPGTYDNWHKCEDLAWAPSKSGETVDVSGSKTYSIELTAPERAGVWQLAAWFDIRNQQAESWVFFTDEPISREFNVNVIDKLTLTVQIQPGTPDIAISVDGSSAHTDTSGNAQFEVSITGSHIVQIPGEVSTGTGVKMVFVRWNDGQTSISRTITMSNDTRLTAEYETQYLLTVNSPMGDPQGSGWYDEGSSVAFSVTSPLTVEGFMGTLGGKYVLDHWSGDLTATTASATITMNGPKTVTAEWHTDNTMPYAIIGGIILVVIVVVAILLLMKRRRAPTRALGTAFPPPPVPEAPTPSSQPPPAAQPPGGKFCINCGAPLPAWATFCGKCGSKQ